MPSASAVIGARAERMQAASALRSLLVCSAKARKVRAVGLVTSSMLSASSACAIGPGAGHAAHHVEAEAAEHEAAHACRMRQGEKRGDARAHRVADDVRALEPEVVEQAARVLRHDRRAVVLEVVQLLALAVAAVVDRR